jgi:hypothetical protein
MNRAAFVPRRRMTLGATAIPNRMIGGAQGSYFGPANISKSSPIVQGPVRPAQQQPPSNVIPIYQPPQQSQTYSPYAPFGGQGTPIGGAQSDQAYNPAMQTSQSAIPVGSYQTLGGCQNIQVIEGMLYAQCPNSTTGQLQQSSLSLSQAVAAVNAGMDIANVNGVLTIQAPGATTATAATATSSITTLIEQYWWVGAIGLILLLVMKGRH